MEDEEWCGIHGSASDGLFKHNLIPYDFVLLESHASAHVNEYKHCKYRPFFFSLYDCSCKTKQVANNNVTDTLIMANQIEPDDSNSSDWFRSKLHAGSHLPWVTVVPQMDDTVN